MRIKKYGLWIIISLFISTTNLSHANTPIGFINKMIGHVQIIRDAKSITAQNGDAVSMNDLIKTQKTGSLGITFMDDTMISIGPDTEFIIDEYFYQPKIKKLSFVSKILKGTLHFVSGNISKIAPGSVKVNTPEGTIGLRGTRFLVKVEGD